MPTIGWSESVPDGQDSLGQGDEVIKSLKTSLRIGLDTEHVWPSAGGDAGVHRLGSARPYYGVQSLVSSSGTDARLMQTSDTSRLFHVGSGGTAFIGGPTVLSIGSFPGTTPQRQYWAAEVGEAITNISGNAGINFANSGFSIVPFVLLTARDLGALGLNVNYFSGNAQTMTVKSYTAAGASASSVSFYWCAIGTRAL